VESLSQDTVLHKPSPTLVFPMKCSPSGRNASSVGLPQATDPARKPAPAGSSPWTTAPSRSLLLCGLSMGFSFPQGISTCSSTGSSTGCTIGQSESPWSSPWAAEESLLWCLQHHLPLLILRPWCLQGCLAHMFSLFSYNSCAALFTLS